MKRFIVSILCVSVFFIGLGALVENVGATFKSDEKALDLMAKARQAIGGDAAVAEIRSMTIIGKTTHTFKFDGTEHTEQGETEIAFQLPDKMMKMVKIGHGDGMGEKMVNRQVDVVVVGKGEGKGEGEGIGIGSEPGKKKILIKKHDGDGEWLTEDGNKVIVRKIEGDEKDISANGKKVMIEKVHGDAEGGYRQNELLRTTLSLLLSAPQGMDVTYSFGGESDVDGTAVNIVNAEFGGSSFKLYLSRSSNLPVMLSYTGQRMPKIMKFKKEGPPPADGAKDTMIFTKKLDGPGKAVEFQVHFSDYRSTGGIQLPYRWTTTAAGATEEVFDVTSYEINPANIADKFQNQKVFVRSPKPVEN